MSSVIVLALLITITKCMEFDSINDLAEDAFVVQCIGQNEQFDLCGNNCEMTCQNLGLPAPHTDLSSTWASCEPGCYCKIGYIRNGFGNCVEHNAFSCLGKFCVIEIFGDIFEKSVYFQLMVQLMDVNIRVKFIKDVSHMSVHIAMTGIWHTNQHELRVNVYKELCSQQNWKPLFDIF
jgi:hypothetical protein